MLHINMYQLIQSQIDEAGWEHCKVPTCPTCVAQTTRPESHCEPMGHTSEALDRHDIETGDGMEGLKDGEGIRIKRCKNCGEVHPPCKRCGASTRCPEDEKGEPFIYCDKCDKEMQG